jgi:hypothetical protein
MSQDVVCALVKRTLGAQCFAVGPSASKTYLPDDEVALSAFLCRGQENSWFIRVNETLCKVGLHERACAPVRRWLVEVCFLGGHRTLWGTRSDQLGFT